MGGQVIVLAKVPVTHSKFPEFHASQMGPAFGTSSWRGYFSSSVNKTRSWGLFWIDFLKPFKGDPLKKIKPFRKYAHLWYICEKMSGKKKSKLLSFIIFPPLLLWFVLQVAALKASYKRFFFSSGKFWCRSSTIKLSLSFSSQLKTPNSLSPQKKNKKITGERPRVPVVHLRGGRFAKPWNPNV